MIKVLRIGDRCLSINWSFRLIFFKIHYCFKCGAEANWHRADNDQIWACWKHMEDLPK